MSHISCLSVAARASRVLIINLLIFAMLGCTVQHTREVTRSTLEELGLHSSVEVSRTNFWVLPHSTKIVLSRTALSEGLNSEFPRLRKQLDELFVVATREKFPLVLQQDTEMSIPAALLAAQYSNADVLLYLTLRQADDKEGIWNKDRLELVLTVLDVRSGRVLDTLMTQSGSGWPDWSEHKVASLVKPSVHAMISQLHARETAAR